MCAVDKSVREGGKKKKANAAVRKKELEEGDGCGIIEVEETDEAKASVPSRVSIARCEIMVMRLD